MGRAVVLSKNNIESELSYAYLHAVASHAGIICQLTNRHLDEAGVDAELRVCKRRLAQDSVLTSFPVDVQLKATTAIPTDADDKLAYPLTLKNYDELRSESTASPMILVVLFLPEKQDEWLTHNAECLVSRRCAYWLSLLGAPEAPTTAKDPKRTTKTVYIPKANQLSVTNLTELMTRFSRQEKIRYDP